VFGKHYDGREAVKVELDSLPCFRVMNSGESASHDDLTGAPRTSTVCEMVCKKDNCLQRVPNWIPAPLFYDSFASDMERYPSLGQIGTTPVCAGCSEHNAAISQIVSNEQWAWRLKSPFGPAR
jgi:hypothetical protein